MKFTIGKAELLSEAQKCVLVVERKTTIPIIHNFLLAAAADMLTISGTDLDSSLVHVLSAKIEKEGAITVPARKLIDILKQLKTVAAKDVTIEELENHWVRLTCGPLQVKLVGMTSKNYPVFAEPPAFQAISVPGPVFTGLIVRTNYAIAREESRYTLNGALLVITADSIRMVATDGHRLASAKHGGQFTVSGEHKTLITKAALAVLQTLVNGEPVEIAKDETTIFFRSKNWTLRSRILTGQFPNYEAVMPKDNRNEAILIAAELKASVARVAMFSDERSRGIRFSFTAENGLVLSASSTEMGEASEKVPAGYKGDPVSIGFNAGFVMDILATLQADAVRIQTRTADMAAIFAPYSDGGFQTQAVVMPLRM